MESGKVNENILDRSVLKKIHIDKSAKAGRPAMGVDSTALMVGEGTVAVATATSDFSEKRAGQIAVMKAVNNLLASGALPAGVSLNITLAPKMREIKLKSIMEQVDETCLYFNIPVLAGHTCVSDGVNRAVVSATAIGVAQCCSPGLQSCGNSKAGGIASAVKPKPGMEIVVTKYIGLTGTSLLAEKYQDQLAQRLPQMLINTAVEFEQYMSIDKEAQLTWMYEDAVGHDASEGGIYQALWELASRAHTGFEIDLKRLPVRQETIEICEFFGINPYELESTGSMVIATNRSDALCLALEEQGIPATVVGRFTDNNDKVIINGDERRFLDSSRVDAIFKVFQEEV